MKANVPSNEIAMPRNAVHDDHTPQHTGRLGVHDKG